jgi:GAF domain
MISNSQCNLHIEHPRVVDNAVAAVAAIAAGDAAGLFIVAERAVVTAARTDDFILELDRVQFEADEGPCLDAVTERRTYLANLAFDERWPRFSRAALEIGIQSVLAIPLPVDRPTALALYSRQCGAFGSAARSRASVFATLAATAIAADDGDSAFRPR